MSDPLRIWIDTDPAVGEPGRDVDDGFAILQALRSPELSVAGISTVFGNTDIERAHRSAGEVLARLGAPSSIGPHRGAASAAELGSAPAASEALGNALATEPMTILALGPLTTVATMLHNRPELTERISRVIFVGGRRPGQSFVMGHSPRLAPDYNFECDSQAARRLVEADDIPLLLTGWEVGMSTTITSHELQAMKAGPPACAWLAAQADAWLALRRKTSGLPGFQPRDSIAGSAAATPELMRIEDVLVARVDIGQDIEPTWRGNLPPTTLQLQAAADLKAGRPARYATQTHPGYMDDVLQRLLST